MKAKKLLRSANKIQYNTQRWMNVENRTGLGRAGREEGREGEKEEGEERERGRRADEEDHTTKQSLSVSPGKDYVGCYL